MLLFFVDGNFTLSIKSKDYIKKIAADGGIKIYVKASVKETRQGFVKQDVVEFKKPALQIEVRYLECLFPMAIAEVRLYHVFCRFLMPIRKYERKWK